MIDDLLVKNIKKSTFRNKVIEGAITQCCIFRKIVTLNIESVTAKNFKKNSIVLLG